MTHWYTEAPAVALAEGPAEPKAEVEPAPAAAPQDQTTGPTQDAPQAEGESLIHFSHALINIFYMVTKKFTFGKKNIYNIK